MNYYKLFELPVSAVADKTYVSKKYIALQKKFHPDFFTNENEADKENALEQSAAINKAYNIFSSKEKTLDYFLQQKGIITTDEKYNLPSDFLMEMMELNEAIDENDTNTREKINAFENELYGEIAGLLETENKTELNEDELLKL
ncbi:MAG: Fe-S protein assembly co-chaperone HscB, partial [Ferruginibacter sp.]|nr:Fe-S protein assembly co-chaperone HscB [Ferruginibacter sp.]